jgi:Fur family transcriptional regulator, ferric uptake regulator
MERHTRQREAIRDAIESGGRPLSPREIHLQAAKNLPGLNIATVYRTLKELLVEKTIARVELPGEAARFELAGKGHHHHFHCKRCDRVFELNGCALGRTTKVPRGFRMEGHDVIVWGLCDACNGRRNKR